MVGKELKHRSLLPIIVDGNWWLTGRTGSSWGLEAISTVTADNGGKETGDMTIGGVAFEQDCSSNRLGLMDSLPLVWPKSPNSTSTIMYNYDNQSIYKTYHWYQY